MSAKYRSPSFLLPNELNTSANTANDTGVNSLYSMDFDGTKYITAGLLSEYISLSAPTSYTISAWIKTSSIYTQGIVGSGANNSSGLIFRIAGGEITFGVVSTWTTSRIITTNANLNDGNWHHVVGTYDSEGDSSGNTLYLYVDGAQIGSNTGNRGVYPFDNYPLFIGAVGAGNSQVNPFNGKIDEVAIFNRALDSTEIAALYGGTSPNIYPSNLIATDLNPIAYYPLGEQAQNSGKLPDTTTNEWQFPNGVLQDYVMDFDSTSPGDYIDCGNDSSLNVSTSNYSLSFWIKTTSTTNLVICEKGSNDELAIQTYTSGNIRWAGINTFETIGVNVSDNNWHHLVFVANGSSSFIYIDGGLNTTGGNKIKASSNTDSFYIGSTAGLYGFNGSLSNVQIFNTALPATGSNSVETLYNNGSPLTSMSGFTSLTNWWKLNADSVYTPSAPNYTKALDFDSASSDYIDTGVIQELRNATAATFSCWLYRDTSDPNQLFGVSVGSTNRVGLTIGHSLNQLRFHVGNIQAQVTNFITTNGWYHIAITYDGSKATGPERVKVYKNGQNVALTNSPGIPTSFGDLNASFKIGAFTTQYLDGKLSNLAIFNSALTPSQVSTLFNFGTPETNISFSPQAWWKLDDQTTITDSSGNGNTGTNNGATDATTSVAVVPSWKIPSALPIQTPNYTTALDFVASESDYIDCGTSLGNSLGTVTSFTVSLWIKANITNGNDFIFNVGDFSNTVGAFALQIKNNELLIKVNNSAYDFVKTFNSTNWNHIAFVYDGSNVNNNLLYLNGQQQTFDSASGTFPSSLNLTGLKTIIGAGYSTPYSFDGQISNASIWDTDLTFPQVSTLFNNGTPEASISFSPVSWWKLDTGGSTITDYGSGGNNGTNNGASPVTSDVLATQPVNGVSTTLPSTALQQSDLQFDSPYSNYSLSFDGAGTSYINIQSSTELDNAPSNPHSFSFWFKSSAAGDVISEKRAVNPFENAQYTIHLGSGYIQWYGGAGGVTPTQTSTTLNDNQWHHIVCVAESTTVNKIYVDGQLDVTSSANRINSAVVTGTFNIGANYIGSYRYEGKLDETSIFNYSLSEAQVLEIYNNGRPKDLTTFSGTAPISWWRLGENAYFDNNSFIVPNSISGAPNGTGSGTVTTMISADAPGTYANGIGTNLDILDRVGDAALSTSNSQSYNMIPSDISPYVPQYVGKQIANNFSMTFDGVDSFFDTGNIDLGINSTLTLWFKPGTSPVVNDYALIGEGSNGFDYVIRKESGAFLVWVGSSFHNYGSAISTNINANGWNFLAIQKAGDTITVYLKNTNGEFDATATKSAWATASMTFDRIGARTISPLAQVFSGQIDEVAGFSEALTPDQIKFDLYEPSLPLSSNKTADLEKNPNLPTPVAWYRMGD